jgi:hypothetical protein
MEIPRSSPRTPPTSGASALGFANAARRLGAAAHANGLAVPAFRCPPRTAGALRTIRRYPGGTVVSVRLRDRPLPVVLDDMVEGVLVANQVSPPDAERLRAVLHASVDAAGATPVDVPREIVVEAPAARAA